MGCKEAVTLFPDYLDGLLDPDTGFGFEEHLEACDFCRNLLESYRKTITLFREAHVQEELPEGLSTRLRSFLSGQLKL